MRTLGILIKTTGFIVAIAIAGLGIVTGIATITVASVVAMFLIFICQTAETYLGYK